MVYTGVCLRMVAATVGPFELLIHGFSVFGLWVFCLFVLSVLLSDLLVLGLVMLGLLEFGWQVCVLPFLEDACAFVVGTPHYHHGFFGPYYQYFPSHSDPNPA